MRAAVLGSPIAHSLSPVLHRAAYRWLELDWSYDAIECTEDELPRFVQQLDSSWAGLSLTMPLKAAVLPMLDEVTTGALLVGGANTVVRHPGGQLYGSNTDVAGIAAALRERGWSVPASTAVLGAGATARSAVAGLAELGVHSVNLYARDPAARATVERLGATLGVVVEGFGWENAPAALSCALVVSTVPAGVTDELAAHVPVRPGTLFDVLYAPWPTPFAARWDAHGGVVVGGLDLLVHQAALQVRAMTRTGTSANELVAVMRPAGVAALTGP